MTSQPVTRPVWLTAAFWQDTAERAVRTAAQTALAVGITDATTSLHVNWQEAGLAVGLATLASVLTSLAGGAVNTGPVKNASFFLASGQESPRPVSAQGEGPTNGPADPYDGPQPRL